MKLEEMKNTLDFAHSNANRYGKQDSEVIEMCILINGSKVVYIDSMISDNSGKIVIIPSVELKLYKEPKEPKEPKVAITEDERVTKELERLKIKEKEIDKKHREILRINSENVILKKKITELENKLNVTENTA